MNSLEFPLAEQAAAEMRRKWPGMDLCLQPVTLLQICGMLQLAQRHPALPAASHQTAETFLGLVKDYFADCPAVLEILRQGDDPANDLNT